METEQTPLLSADFAGFLTQAVLAALTTAIGSGILL
jgi:hypothetical protein